MLRASGFGGLGLRVWDVRLLRAVKGFRGMVVALLCRQRSFR